MPAGPFGRPGITRGGLAMTAFYQDKNVLLAVTGGVAAYKAAELTRLLIKAGANVKVVMTDAAQEFLPAKTLAVLSTRPVLTDASWQGPSSAVDHVHLAKWADLIVLAPLTANTLAKLASGLADNVLTATVMASAAHKVAVPAMNDVMWSNPAVQRNVDQLKQDGFDFIGPASGFLAEGYEAKGRMVEPAEIVKAVADLHSDDFQDAVFEEKPLAGKKVVITAGGTREPIDPVRYLTNKSSGKMGYALAEAARAAGATVTLVAATSRQVSPAIQVILVGDTREMLAAVQKEMATADVYIGAAAVSDFRVAEVADHKVKKHGDEHMILDLVQNPDILKTVGETKKPGQVVVGFAAETENLVENAQAKLVKKHADLIVANNVLEAGAGFNKDTNKVTLVTADQEPIQVAAKLKTEVAEDIIALVADLLTS